LIDFEQDPGIPGLGYDDLYRIMLSSVKAMSSMVELQDLFVRGHQQRVSLLSATMAGRLGMDDFTVEGIRIASLVHDLGKIAIPAEISYRPGPLNRAERQIIETHPLEAYRILKKIDFPWPVARHVLQHQERLDGSGYPYGLEGEQISLEGRILGVADTVDAMLSHRPFRTAFSLDEVMAEIEHLQGIKYDPDVVAICLTLFRDEGFTLQDS
jgi:putative two-component system response regulator